MFGLFTIFGAAACGAPVGGLGQVDDTGKTASALTGGTPWVVNGAGNIFEWNGNSFVIDALPGCASAIGVGQNNQVWILGCGSGLTGSNIYRRTSTGYVQVAGTASAIAVSPEGTPWVVNKIGNIYEWNGTSFAQVAGCAKSIGVGPSGQAWASAATV
jgi:hypothetical protein